MFNRGKDVIAIASAHQIVDVSTRDVCRYDNRVVNVHGVEMIQTTAHLSEETIAMIQIQIEFNDLIGVGLSFNRK